MLGSNPGQGRRSFLLFNRFPVVFDKVGYGAGTGCGNRAKAARTVKEQCCVVGTIVCFPAQVAAGCRKLVHGRTGNDFARIR